MAGLIYVVRHAKAGHRDPWATDDANRELTAPGWAQSKALAEVLAPLTTGGRLISSPYVRCVQTLEPLRDLLANATGTTRVVEADDRLHEGSAPGPVVELIGGLPAGSVCCSHGDVIPDLIAHLERRGCAIIGTPRFEKASTWVLERADDGTCDRAWSWAPPG